MAMYGETTQEEEQARIRIENGNLKCSQPKIDSMGCQDKVVLPRRSSRNSEEKRVRTARLNTVVL